MFTCPECEQSINQSSEACPYCGAELNSSSGAGEAAPARKNKTRILVMWVMLLAILWAIAWFAFPWRLAGTKSSAESQARDALAELCRTYWRPIFSFVQLRDYSVEDAQDLTQDFFVTILKKNWLQHADRNRGRFRSLLLRSL